MLSLQTVGDFPGREQGRKWSERKERSEGPGERREERGARGTSKEGEKERGKESTGR